MINQNYLYNSVIHVGSEETRFKNSEVETPKIITEEFNIKVSIS